MADVHVVGVGMHPFGRFSEKTVPELARDAIWAALRDAGADAHSPEIAFVANCYLGFFTGQHDAVAPIVIGRSGLAGMPMVHVEGGGAAGSVAFHQAVLAVKSGEYRTALAVGVEKLYVPNDPSISITAIATSGEASVATNMGLTWVGDLTMSARRLMDLYGWTADDFALVASKNREHAALNAEAELRERISPEEVLAGRVVAAPLTRPMCAGAAVDGAAAVLVSDGDFARRLGNGKHPYVAGMGVVGGRYVSNRVPDPRPGMLSMDEADRAFALAYERAGLGPDDLELIQVHDSVAPEELLAYRMLGLCGAGDEPKLLRSGATRLDGRVPVNTDGGLIGRGHPIAASGVAQVVETVRQLRGSAGARQVVGPNGRYPRVGAMQNAGAQGGPSGGVAVSAAFLLRN
jgi:acetyl-CoA acyltransferase